ncbi:hypothetical protein FNV43_RR06829 [Rhamnella rubrinervis]|uniref:Uncharacterized protein n=1 Tax=Rhamnella rubrinervis TaxID=2594499 RepID=A0A8K0MMC6_9ROSA|nr:hypothetical protein FNV43_RR06829 [Rhamnella rubrinervis]
MHVQEKGVKIDFNTSPSLDPVHSNRLKDSGALFSVVHSIKVFFKKLRMVRALEEEQENYRSRLFHFRGMYENAGRHTKSLSIESASALGVEDDWAPPKSQAAKPLTDSDKQQPGSLFNRSNDKGPKSSRLNRDEIAAKEVRDRLVAGQSCLSLP